MLQLVCRLRTQTLRFEACKSFHLDAATVTTLHTRKRQFTCLQRHDQCTCISLVLTCRSSEDSFGAFTSSRRLVHSARHKVSDSHSGRIEELESARQRNVYVYTLPSFGQRLRDAPHALGHSRQHVCAECRACKTPENRGFTDVIRFSAVRRSSAGTFSAMEYSINAVATPTHI